MSLSARRAWIEMLYLMVTTCALASLSARRAWIEIPTLGINLTKGVQVALRKESVDRNSRSEHGEIPVQGSLSARRAWIEISSAGGNPVEVGVALRKESVDRNVVVFCGGLLQLVVALRKESVDRNMIVMILMLRSFGRSPQGERG